MSDARPVRPERPAAPRPEGARPAGMVERPTALDVVAFLVELVAFGTLALWGFAAWPFPWNVVVGLGAPIVAILVWALFVSPKAMLAVHPFMRAIAELAVYLSATVAWWSLGQPWIGLAFAVVAVTVGLLAGRRRLA